MALRLPAVTFSLLVACMLWPGLAAPSYGDAVERQQCDGRDGRIRFLPMRLSSCQTAFPWRSSSELGLESG